MATGITSDAVTKIQSAITDYRTILYRNNLLSGLASTSEFNQAIKGEKTKQAFKDAAKTIQDAIDNYTDYLQRQLKDSIQNVNTSYVKQDENATTFVNLKNKHKS